MEPNWNKETDEQIIGRGIRYLSHVHLPENLRYTKVYKLYMFKPEQVYADDPLPSADEILFELSYQKKDPIIKSFMNSLMPFTIENNDCDKCCIVKKQNNQPSINDEDFFNYYKITKKTKLDIDDDDEEKPKKRTYQAPGGKTYMFDYKGKKSTSKPKSKPKSAPKSDLISKSKPSSRTKSVPLEKESVNLVEIKCGDIIKAKEKYIVQQCNCTGDKSAGLSKAIKDNFGVNPYDRKNNDIPGTYKIYDNIVCLFAQRNPGKSSSDNDTKEMRLNWFKFSFDKFIKENNGSIAIPYNIGCGLAGGNWDDYLKAIKSISDKHNRPITIYNKDC
jgi:hypothetical protein